MTDHEGLVKASFGLVNDHENASLRYHDGIFTVAVRRFLTNDGMEPIERYLIRIAVDRYPHDSQFSNEFYRKSPLTLQEIQLQAHCFGEPMTQIVSHDRDAAKEIWLLFKNSKKSFPLLPGQSAELSYQYQVSEHKWGPWFQRAIRLPTRKLTIDLDFPAELSPVVSVKEIAMTPEPSPIRLLGEGEIKDGRSRYSWTTDNPRLGARYRCEWSLITN